MAAPTTAPIDLSAAMVTAPTALADWLVIAPMGLMIALGAALMMVRHKLWLHGWIAIPGLVALVLLDALLLYRVAVHGPFTMTAGRWLPPFGISFTADLLGALLAFASGLVALAAGIYGLRDINDTGRRYGFYPFLLLMMAGVTGAFLTGDIFNLYVWFEVLLISSFGLLILGSEREQIDGALKYAVLNLLGTTLFLIAVGYLYAIFGTLNMAQVASLAGEQREGAPLITLSALFILAFAMKAAAFPVNFWLPASYHTPRIVVAALFGGLLTKVGVYALMRVMVMLFPLEREELSLVLAVIAALTMLLGALGALAQSDLRRMAGFAVIAGIGNVIAGVAIGGATGVGGAILYAMHSIVVMTALYLLIGEAARIGGSWSLQTLGGLYREAPWIAAGAFVIFFATAGLPPFSGLWPKIMLLKAALDVGAWWLSAALLVSALILTLALGRVFLLAFWRPQLAGAAVGAPIAPNSWQRSTPIAGLVAVIVVFGLFPDAPVRLAQAAASSLADPAAYIQSVFPAGGAE
ncbi:multicomponent Na+:H+ antiporter subunit D [Pseudorhizobium tarimense]|uniref:Multicomponent Na+:H+ antiporter subunit D n=1 Tax=Pseudorhizobium tarimense TaxID=1079109 RepID=A0ABV2H0F2_9HYPH|nr:Na+/H+ antiporter subunit D [Pseudorhizobium tarimense]MCJ8517353.1 Na+/H+ antiporter subunit D [Pseudorhizobium tarimense]